MFEIYPKEIETLVTYWIYLKSESTKKLLRTKYFNQEKIKSTAQFQIGDMETDQNGIRSKKNPGNLSIIWNFMCFLLLSRKTSKLILWGISRFIIPFPELYIRLRFLWVIYFLEISQYFYPFLLIFDSFQVSRKSFKFSVCWSSFFYSICFRIFLDRFLF